MIGPMTLPLDDDGAWITCRLFVSSTYRDFGAERELLARVVMPKLRARLDAWRIELIDVDLRWGIPREIVEGGRVAELCMETVESCRPLFLGFVGDYYGDPAGQMGDPLRERFSWLATHETRSLGDLEMTAALRQPERAVFCMRDPSCTKSAPQEIRDAYHQADPERGALLAGLKERIRASGAHVIDSYACEWEPDGVDPFRRTVGTLGGLQELARELEQVLFATVALHCGRVQIPYSVELHADYESAQRRYLQMLTREFAGRRSEIDQLWAALEEPGDTPVVLTGARGVGKSSLAAKLAEELIEKSRSENVFVHHFWAGSNAMSLSNLCQRLLRHLSRTMECLARPDSLADAEETNIEEILRETVAQIPADNQQTLVLDGIEAISVGDPSYRLRWVPLALPSHVRILVTLDERAPAVFVATTRDGVPITLATDPRRSLATRSNLPGRGLESRWRTMRLGPMCISDLQAQVRAHLAMTSRSLAWGDLERIVASNKSRRPLTMRVALEVLRLSTSFEHFEAMLDQVSGSESAQLDWDDLVPLLGSILDHLAEALGCQTPRDVLSLLAATRTGLSEAELTLLSGAAEGDPAVPVTLAALQPLLFRVEGRHRLMHPEIADCLEKVSRVPGEWMDVDEAFRRIAKHFVSESSSERRALEIIHCHSMCESGLYELQAIAVADPTILRYATRVDPEAVRAQLLATMCFEHGVDLMRWFEFDSLVKKRLSELEEEADGHFRARRFALAESKLILIWELARSPCIGSPLYPALALVNLMRVAQASRNWFALFRWLRRLDEIPGKEVVAEQRAAQVLSAAISAYHADDTHALRLIVRQVSADYGPDLSHPEVQSIVSDPNNPISDYAILHRQAVRSTPPLAPPATGALLSAKLGRRGLSVDERPRLLWIDRMTSGGLPRLELQLHELEPRFVVEFMPGLDDELLDALSLVTARNPQAFSAVITHAPPCDAFKYFDSARRIEELRIAVKAPIVVYTSADPVHWAVVQAADAIIHRTAKSAQDATLLISTVESLLQRVWPTGAQAESPMIERRSSTTRLWLSSTSTRLGVYSLLVGRLKILAEEAGRPVTLRSPGSALCLNLDSGGRGTYVGNPIDILLGCEVIEVEGADARAELLARQIHFALLADRQQDIASSKKISPSPDAE